MKKCLHLLSSVFLLTLFCALAFPATAQYGRGGDRYELMVTGTVRDKDSGKKLENVTVSLEGSSIATVTNGDGYFSLKFPRGYEPVLNFSLLGYESGRFTLEESGNGRYVANISMKTALTELDEVVVFGDARGLVEEALRKIPGNYPTSNSLLSAFYRETVQKGHRYVSVAEAIMDVYKTTYTHRSASYDVVKLAKARRLLSQRADDTLGVKIAGGPNLSLTMDVVKNADVLFDRTSMDYYVFLMMPTEKLDGRVQYVVEFIPRVTLSYALFMGKVYIDKESLAFTRAEFSLDLSDTEKATAALLRKKPPGLRFRPQEMTFLVTYRDEGGVTRLNYMRSEMRFKCDLKRLAFSSAYVACTEMVVVERDDSEDIIIDHKDAFRKFEVFEDVVREYWDADFWSEYNIIEPTESLETAVKRLKRKL